ncbi:pilus assembly protein [Microbulbifer sp. MCCC 1A16149]|uniref:pilus assembly protein n=1 Tax=Microbulbifer sp. MCCC 1A16149 TaxID=3411322 RepID=UPI003D14D51D
MLLKKIKARLSLTTSAALLAVGFAHSVQSLELAQSPLFLSQPVKPIVMLNMSNDHQLYFKAYDDYTDLDEDGTLDTTYDKTIEYYGYFDNGKCYKYQNARFEPSRVADSSRYCNYDTGTGEWSGNFLNWATMTRMDAVRKILYGGYRSTDNDYDADVEADDGVTVLERALLPHDAHSFAKYYNGSDIGSLTPFGDIGGSDTSTSGITLCNTTPGSGNSEGVTNAPEIRVAQGNYSLWASNERWQCRWKNESGVGGNQGVNGNDYAKTGMRANSQSPLKNSSEGVSGVKLGDGEYNVRVQVCVSGLEEDNCKAYPNGNQKPTGLLQKYGEDGDILFGLLTGSYGKNKSGGVLRKNVSSLADEVNVSTDGTFTSAIGIVKTLDLLRIYGYDYDDGVYNSADSCPWGRSSFTDGNCSNWGNPQSEIYLESLRYLAGRTASSNFAATDSNYISNLPAPAWDTPLDSSNYCAALSVIQFNASTSSYDGDYTDATFSGVDTWTDKIGDAENIHGGTYFVGENGTDNNQLCTAKTVNALSGVEGTCPDAPRLEGTYDIAGMAYFARANSIRNDLPSDQTVRTYGVALAPAVPKVEIPVPGDSGKTISILPACRNTHPNPDGNCAIVDFKVISQDLGVDTGAGVLANKGKLYVNWEDSEQGGDFDQDMWGIIDYEVTSTQVKVTTNAIAESTDQPMGFGFVIGGTTNDGFHVNSGVEGFTYSGTGCSDGCNLSDAAFPATFNVGTSTAKLLETPLYYAAKWGGYSDDENGNAPSEADIAAGEASTYFYAIDPSELEASLSEALEQVAAAAGSASSVATNSTRLGTDTVIYQALFNSADWSGELKALTLNSDGTVGTVKWQTEDSDFTNPTDREIYTHNGTAGAEFTWDTISAAQQADLVGDDTEVEGRSRLAWVRGSDESGLRSRESLLGDIVNSSPVFAGRKKHNFHLLSEELGGTLYATYYATYKQNRKEVLYVSANDGMLHAFDAANGEELFAYVPAGVYEKLRKLSGSDYGTNSNPHTYNVDGPLFVGDAFINGSWKNVLVGTLGAGGRGLFALDVTDPTNFDEGDVLFDFTDEDLLAGDFTKLGNITNEPIIAPTYAGWRVILGNGYNSDGGNAHLFAVSLDNPTTATKVMAAGTSGANGLSGAALLPNGTGEVVAAYAGDLLGNMWKFDISAGNTNSWGVDYRSGGNDVPLYTAAYDSVDADGADITVTQPITSTPTLGLNAEMENAVMVYFGTGSYLTSSDNSAGDTVNSFYAIADTGEEVSGRDQLFAKTISTEADGRRVVDGNADTDWWLNKKGWYLDFTYNGSVTGERIISKPLLIYDRLLFPTMITSSDPCSFGGSGWLMELVAVGDRYEGHSIFGEDGIEVDYAVISYSEVIRSGEKAYLPTSNIKGELDVTEGAFPSEAVGRMSWRQLR